MAEAFVAAVCIAAVVAVVQRTRRAGRRIEVDRRAAIAARRLPSNVTRLVDVRRPTFWNYEVDGD